jgi:hypothetical protein
LPIVETLLGLVLATAETSLIEPLGIFFAAMPNKRTPQKRVGKDKLEAASARKTTPRLVAAMIASRETRPEGLMGAAQTEDEESLIQQEPGPSGGCGGQAEVKVEAWKRATKDPTANHLLSDDRESEDISEVAGSHSLAVRLKKKGEFSQKSAGGETGEQHFPAAEHTSVDGMGNDGGKSNFAPISIDSDKENLASLSFGLDTGYLAETYFIINFEVTQNCSLALVSLLRRGAIETVMLILEEQFVEREVVFPVFARYFLARGRSFKIMIADLLKHKDSGDDKPPLVLSAEVPRFRHIAHKRMGYLRATYHLFKDTVSEMEKDNRALVKAHMKMCVKHYHALIPQLDLVKSQEGVHIDHALSYDELGLPRSEREKKRRQGNLEQQLSNQSKEPRKRMISAPNYAETLEKFRSRNGGGLGKGRETKGLLIKTKEDLQLLKKQITSIAKPLPKD